MLRRLLVASIATSAALAPRGSRAEAAAPEAAAPRTERAFADALVDVGASFELGGRWFAYTDGLLGDLRPYDVFGAPGLALRGEVYPLARTHVPILRRVGVTLGFTRAIGLDSAIAGGDAIATTWDTFTAGLRLRYPTGGDGAPILGASGGLFWQRFRFDDAPEAVADELPDVSYAGVRGGLDARIPLGPVALLVGADYLAPRSAGAVADRFRDASVGGIDVRGGVALGLAEGVELRLTADYTRFFYAFEPEPGDAYVAGGALDETARLGLGASFFY